jgi:uncharacterized membrane protein
VNSILRAAALGTATAARSQLGPAAVAWSSPSPPPGSSSVGARVGRLLAGRGTRRGLALGAAGELVGDKLPKAPSRTEPLGLVPRLGFGALGGAVLASRAGESEPAAAAAGLAAAAVWSFAGVRWRTWAAARFGHDLPGALAEDAGAVLLAGIATGLLRRRSR